MKKPQDQLKQANRQITRMAKAWLRQGARCKDGHAALMHYLTGFALMRAAEIVTEIAESKKT